MEKSVGTGSLLGPRAWPGGHPARLPSLPSGPTGKGWFPARGSGAQGLRTRDPGPGKRPPGLAGFGFLGEAHCTPSSRLLLLPPPLPLAVEPEPGRASGQLRLAKQHGFAQLQPPGPRGLSINLTQLRALRAVCSLPEGGGGGAAGWEARTQGGSCHPAEGGRFFRKSAHSRPPPRLSTRVGAPHPSLHTRGLCVRGSWGRGGRTGLSILQMRKQWGAEGGVRTAQRPGDLPLSS